MLTIQIGNENIQYLDAVETEEFFNGSSRRTITVTCESTAISIDKLNSLLTEENLKSITVTNDKIANSDGSSLTNIYDDYVLKLSCGIQNVLVKNDTPDSAAKYEDRLIFKIGKRTYIEEQLHKLGL